MAHGVKVDLVEYTLSEKFTDEADVYSKNAVPSEIGHHHRHHHDCDRQFKRQSASSVARVYSSVDTTLKASMETTDNHSSQNVSMMIH